MFLHWNVNSIALRESDGQLDQLRWLLLVRVVLCLKQIRFQPLEKNWIRTRSPVFIFIQINASEFIFISIWTFILRFFFFTSTTNNADNVSKNNGFRGESRERASDCNNIIIVMRLSGPAAGDYAPRRGVDISSTITTSDLRPTRHRHCAVQDAAEWSSKMSSEKTVRNAKKSFLLVRKT